MLFVKAAKFISFAIMFLPLGGCAIATGIIFSALIKGIAYSPEQEDSLFNYATIGFAFVETFCFMILLAAAVTIVM